MNIAKVITLIGLAVMSVAIVYALVAGDFSTEGAWIGSHPWGQVSLADLYVGFTLFSMWIVYREKSLARSTTWIVLMMTLGNWTASLYALLALYSSGGDWQRFWMGNHVKA